MIYPDNTVVMLRHKSHWLPEGVYLHAFDGPDGYYEEKSRKYDPPPEMSQRALAVCYAPGRNQYLQVEAKDAVAAG
jgi:hypothetical protein